MGIPETGHLGYQHLWIREFVKNSEKNSNCENFAEMVESNHNFASTIYLGIMTITSSGDKYILVQLHIMIIVSILKRRRKRKKKCSLFLI